MMDDSSIILTKEEVDSRIENYISKPIDNFNDKITKLLETKFEALDKKVDSLSLQIDSKIDDLS